VFELNEPQYGEPSRLAFAPLHSLQGRARRRFEQPSTRPSGLRSEAVQCSDSPAAMLSGRSGSFSNRDDIDACHRLAAPLWYGWS